MIQIVNLPAAILKGELPSLQYAFFQSWITNLAYFRKNCLQVRHRRFNSKSMQI
jgi:hypothetical protein